MKCLVRLSILSKIISYYKSSDSSNDVVYEQNIQMTLFEQLCYDSMASKWGPRGFYNFGRSAVDRSRAKTAVSFPAILPSWKIR